MFKKVSIVLLVNVLGMGMAYVLQFALARVFGTAGYGVISLLFVWVGFLSLGSLLGIDVALLKLISVEFERGKMRKVRGIFAMALKAVVANTVVLGLALIAVATVFREHSAMLDHYYPYLVAILGLTVCQRLVVSLLNASSRPAYSVVVGRVALPIAVLIGLGIFFVVADKRPTISEYFVLYAVTAGLVIALGLVVAWAALSGRDAANEERSDLSYGALYKLAFPMCLSSAMYVLATQLDILLVGAMLDMTQVGIYAAAVRVSRLIGLPFTAMTIYVVPKLASLHAEGEVTKLQALINNAGKLIAMSTVPLAAGAILLAAPILGLLGKGFEDGAMVVAVLVVSQTLNSLAGPAGNLLNMTGHQTVVAWTIFVTNVLNLGFTIAMIHWFGLIGAAIATGASTLIWNAMLIYYAKVRVGISMLQWLSPQRAEDSQ